MTEEKNRSLFRTASLMSTIEMTRPTGDATKILRLRAKIKPIRRDSWILADYVYKPRRNGQTKQRRFTQGITARTRQPILLKD